MPHMRSLSMPEPTSIWFGYVATRCSRWLQQPRKRPLPYLPTQYQVQTCERWRTCRDACATRSQVPAADAPSTHAALSPSAWRAEASSWRSPKLCCTHNQNLRKLNLVTKTNVSSSMTVGNATKMAKKAMNESKFQACSAVGQQGPALTETTGHC